MKIFSLVNHKGGVGKSTLSFNMAFYLSQSYKVLVIDMDPQGNLSLISKSDPSSKGTYEAMFRGDKIENCIQQITPSYYLISGGYELSAADEMFSESERFSKRVLKLREVLEKIRGIDFVVIDTPPHLRILTANALSVSNKVIIPALADVFSSNGLIMLSKFIQKIKDEINPSLSIDGILINRYKRNSIFQKEMVEVLEKIANKLGTKVYESKIRESVKVSEGSAQFIPIYQYEGGAKYGVSEDMRSFLEEFIKGVE